MKRVVGFSGGVDSQATLRWCREQFGDNDVIALNSNAGGNEHPLTDQFVDNYSKTVFPVIRVKALVKDLGNRGTFEGETKDRRQEFNDDDELTFDRLAYIRGTFPSRKMQFCTEHLKLAPQRRWCQENLKGVEFARYVGVRRDESQLRSCVKDCEFDTYFNCLLYRPVAAWSKKMVFAYLKSFGEAYNPLYRLGFGRVGCAPCINSGKDDIANWAKRFPEMIDKIRAWEKLVGRPFFTPCVPKCQANWVDQVVDWSKTEHGGKIISLASFFPPLACESKYGLCE